MSIRDTQRCFFDMERNRIQKLLLSEYCDFSDTVLIESPFAETTRDGQGLREVALGLTSSRLVIAADILKNNSEFTCPPELDPSIESFELVSVYPLEFVNLSIFRRRKRRTLKARLIDGRAKYYELGGMECKNILWSYWISHVRNIRKKKESGSSLSETTAASSSSISTLYLFSSEVEFKDTDKNYGNKSQCRIWAHYGGAGDNQTISWPRKDVYLGPSYNELAHGYYTPIPVRFAGASLEDLAYELTDATPKNLVCKKTCSSWPCAKNSKSSKKNEFNRGGALCDVLFTREHRRYKKKNNQQDSDDYSSIIDRHRATVSETSAIVSRRRNSSKNSKQQKRKSGSPRKHGTALAPKLSRFGFGVEENCRSGLYLEPWEGDRDHFRHTRSGHVHVDSQKLIDRAVSIWEERKKLRNKMKHPRRYALATAAHFLHALGPWSVQPGERESVQRRRASSAVGIRRQPVEAELRLPVSKRQLTASVSMTSLEPGKSGAMGCSTRGKVILFWTPEYWYRPRAATTAYRELRRHLSLLKDFRIDKERVNKKKFFCRRKTSGFQGDCKDSSNITNTEEKSSCILSRIFSSKDTRKKSKDKNEDKESGATNQLKRLLRMDLRITAWDFDSTTIAKQLSLIDRDLFLRIPIDEIEILIYQKSSRNAPNIGAWIAFSHRISCLVSSEILATKKIDMRTRILARFINAADKCYAIGNFQSCRSILAGLQSPPIYRLKDTWARLRIHHSTRYETMERLCKIYRNTNSRTYRRAWNRCERKPPVLPYVGDLLARILADDKISSKTFFWKNQPCDSTSHSCCSKGDISRLKSTNEKIEDVEKNVVEPRRSLGRKILSAAMKIRCSKSRSISLDAQKKESSLNPRQKFLARKVCTRWRKFVVAAKILKENEAKIKAMNSKRRKVFEIGTWITDCQRHSQGYDFVGHSLAWEFLLKARYREDRENFFLSLKLEPPCG